MSELVGVLVISQKVEGVFTGRGGGSGQEALLGRAGWRGRGGGSRDGAATAEGGREEELGGLVGEHGVECVDGEKSGRDLTMTCAGFLEVQDTGLSSTSMCRKFQTGIPRSAKTITAKRAEGSRWLAG